MEHYCKFCGRPAEGADIACNSCRTNQQDGERQSTAGVETKVDVPFWTTGNTLGMVSALFLLEGVAPSWTDRLYSSIAVLSFGRIPPDEAPWITLSAAAVIATLIFAIWLHDRWSFLRQVGKTSLPGWLAVGLCLIPLVCIPATLYFVATIRHRFSDRPGPLLISQIGVITWIWWATYQLSALAAGINAANGSGWTAACILYGISCGALAYVTSDVRSSPLGRRLAQSQD